MRNPEMEGCGAIDEEATPEGLDEEIGVGSDTVARRSTPGRVKRPPEKSGSLVSPASR